MYFITEKIDLQTLTPGKIREIVEEEFDTLATECGELRPSEVNQSEWLALYMPTGQLAIAGNYESNANCLLVASINAGVCGWMLDEEVKAAGIIEDKEDENFDPDAREELNSKIFRDMCKARQVTVCVEGVGELAWDEDWAEQILARLVEIMDDFNEQAVTV